MIISITMILAGVAAVAWSLPAAHRLGSPWDTLASLGMPVGIVLAGLGVILLIVPDFFAR